MGKRDRLRKQAIIDGQAPPHRVDTTYSRFFQCSTCGEKMPEYAVKDHPHFKCACGKQAEIVVTDISGKNALFCHECLEKIMDKNEKDHGEQT